MKNWDEELKKALTADEEGLRSLVYHPSPQVISNILLNRNMTEDLALVIAGRRNVQPHILESLYQSGKWKESYHIVITLCKNPRTPQKISLALVKTLRIIDLSDLTRNKQVPISVRTKAEAYIIEKILTMPLGIKISLARRSSSNVLLKLIEDGMKEVVRVCLDNPLLTEGDISKVIHMKKIASHVIRQIAEHPKWANRYDIQRALIRHRHTPLSCVVTYLHRIKTTDLKELRKDPEVPSSTKPFLYRELLDRGETVPASIR
jgi:hypothetical protein